MFNTLAVFVRTKWLYLLVGAVLIFALSLLFQGTPKLVETNLINGQTNVDLNTELVLVFDKPVNQKKVRVISTPPDDYTLTKDAPAKLRASHSRSFYQDTNYVVEIYYNNSLVQALSFHTQKSESNPRDLQVIQEEVERDYPVAAKLPLTKSNYQIVYVAPLTLQVELYDESLDQRLIAKEIAAWLQSEGIDPTSHELVFILPEHPAPTTYH